MSVYRSFRGISDSRDATVVAIIDQAIHDRSPNVGEAEAITPGDLVQAAAAYGIRLTPEDAASQIYTRAARLGSLPQ